MESLTRKTIYEKNMQLIRHLKLKFLANFDNFEWEDLIDLIQVVTAVRPGSVCTSAFVLP